jgi:hypothetical protein
MADAILKNRPVKDEITRLRSRFLEMQYCLPREEVRSMIQDLLGIVI